MRISLCSGIVPLSDGLGMARLSDGPGIIRHLGVLAQLAFLMALALCVFVILWRSGSY